MRYSLHLVGETLKKNKIKCNMIIDKGIPVILSMTQSEVSIDM
jgi:hypothetical protein